MHNLTTSFLITQLSLTFLLLIAPIRRQKVVSIYNQLKLNRHVNIWNFDRGQISGFVNSFLMQWQNKYLWVLNVIKEKIKVIILEIVWLTFGLCAISVNWDDREKFDSIYCTLTSWLEKTIESRYHWIFWWKINYWEV